MTFQIPGSIILMGEYAVLEEEGEALTAAIYPCAQVSLTEDDRLTGNQNGRSWSADFNPDTSRESSLPEVCLTVLREFAVQKGRDLKPRGVRIDTDSFASGSRKLGYGSSAAACVGFIRGVLKGQSWQDEIETDNLVRLAFRAHSLFQGMRGSGYDVYTSCSRGFNMFRNGEQKEMTPLRLSFLPDLYLFHSRESTSTVRGIDRYRSWKKENPSEASRFFNSSGTLIRDFLNSGTWEEGRKILMKAGELVRNLGEDIGVNSEADLPDEILSCDHTAWKASGSGNELILIASPHDLSEVSGVEKVRIYYG